MCLGLESTKCEGRLHIERFKFSVDSRVQTDVHRQIRGVGIGNECGKYPHVLSGQGIEG